MRFLLIAFFLIPIGVQASVLKEIQIDISYSDEVYNAPTIGADGKDISTEKPVAVEDYSINFKKARKCFRTS